MKITYVHHSSFAIEFPESKKVLLFDYFNGELPQWDKDYRIYVFASHKHYDHFSKKIFNFALEYPDITYILAKETRMNEKYMDRWNIPIVARDRINYVGKDREYDFDDIHVTTLTSTDSGVAFIIRTEGKTLYHAGDLNWWWWDQYTPQQSLQMEKDFKAQIDKFDKTCILMLRSCRLISGLRKRDFSLALITICDAGILRWLFLCTAGEDLMR